jgi:hypothetical protein
MLQQAKPYRLRRRESLVVIDHILCEQVVSLFDHVDRHYHPSYETYQLAHNPMTSFSVSRPVCFPLPLGLYRRHEELPRWEAARAKHVLGIKSPTDKKASNRLYTQVEAEKQRSRTDELY